MHDFCRSHVTIQDAAAFAAVISGRKRFDGDNPAFRAGLAGSAWIDFDELATGAFSLVASERGDKTPRGVIYVLGQHPGCQAFDVEFFDCDPTETIDQIAADLVTEVAAAIADPGVIAGQCDDAFAPHVGPALATNNGALTQAQALRGLLRPAGSRDCLAIAERYEVGQSEINADAIRPGALDCFDLDVKDDVPLACLTGEDRGLRLARHLAMPSHLDLTGNADEAETAGLADCQPVPDAEIGGVITSAGTEAGEPGFCPAPDAGEECLEAFVELAQNLLLRGTGPSTVCVGSVAANDGQRHNLLIAPDRDTLAVSFYTMLKTGIVEFTEIAKHTRQNLALRLIWLKAIFVAENHDLFLIVFRSKSSSVYTA